MCSPKAKLTVQIYVEHVNAFDVQESLAKPKSFKLQFKLIKVPGEKAFTDLPFYQ